MSKRLSLSLAEVDELRVQQFTRPGLPREVLERALRSGGRQPELGSEAAVIRALVEIGARTLEEDLLDAGYAAAAAQFADGDDDRRAARRRHLERTGRQQ